MPGTQEFNIQYDERRRRLAEYEHKAKLQEQEVMDTLKLIESTMVIHNDQKPMFEHQETRKMLEVISVHEKESYQRQLNIEACHRIIEEEAKNKAIMERWRLEDDQRKLQTELTLRGKQRQREQQVFEYERQKIEMQHKLHKLEKEVYISQIERERKLRCAEEDYMLTANQMKQEVEKKNEYLEALEQNAIQELNAKNQAIVDMSDNRVNAIYQQKKEIEEALEEERREQERLQRLVDKQKFEKELMNMKLVEEAKRIEENCHINSLNKNMENEKRLREQANKDLYEKEQEIMEKDKFQNLLLSTDNNLKKIQEEQLVQRSVEINREEIEKARIEREDRMNQIMQEREQNFQDYTLQRQNQIENHYGEMMSPSRSPISSRKSRTEIYSPGMENVSPNYQNSDLSYSMNQQYKNKDVYEVSKSQARGLNLKDQILQNQESARKAYPLSEHLDRSNMNLEDSQTNESRSDLESQTDIDALRKHEQSKYAFESYQQSWGDHTGSQTFGEGILPVKDNTFGHPSYSSTDFQKMSVMRSHQNMDDEYCKENQEVLSLNQQRNVMSNLSSQITEEAEGESSIYSGDDISESSQTTVNAYGQNMNQKLSYSQANSSNVNGEIHYNNYGGQDRYLNYGESREYSGNYGPASASNSQLDNTSEISISTESHHGNPISHLPQEQMSINPFYKPNPTYSGNNQIWKGV